VAHRGIFINYRSEDSSIYGAMLHKELAGRFGQKRVFLDSESIPAGTDYPEQLLRRVQRARVVLAVIGPRWLTATGPDGRRCIDDPSDWTRRELVEAFAVGVRVVPVLIDGGRMPSASELPHELAALSRLQFRELRHRNASADLNRLANDLAATDAGLRAAERRAKASRIVITSSATAISLTAAILAYLILHTPTVPGPTTAPTTPITSPPTQPPLTSASSSSPPTSSVPPQTSASLSDGWGIDFDSGSVDTAFTLTGADLSIGPGLEGGMVDAGDGAAILLVTARPTRPPDCAGGQPTTTIQLPLPAGTHLCVLTGRGKIATLNITYNSSSAIRFTYRVWPRSN
jgi:hypothetical protein